MKKDKILGTTLGIALGIVGGVALAEIIGTSPYEATKARYERQQEYKKFLENKGITELGI